MVLEPNARLGLFSKSGGRFAQRAWFRTEKFTHLAPADYRVGFRGRAHSDRGQDIPISQDTLTNDPAVVRL